MRLLRAGRSRALRTGALCACGVLALSACSGTADDDDSLGGDGTVQVVASFYPLVYLTERVGADLVEVVDLTPSAADPHHLELAPVDIATMDAADMLLYLDGFQPAVDDAVDELTGPVSLDVAGPAQVQDTSDSVRGAASSDHDDSDAAGEYDHAHGPDDPHFWLDTNRFADVADAIAEELTTLAPDHGEEFQNNAQALRADLEALDDDFEETLPECDQNIMVVSHTAFGYLAQRYHLEQVGISGLDPEAEPSPARLAEIRQVVQAEDIDTIYTEALASPQVTQVLAEELDLEVDVLDPIEGLVDPDQDYLSLMEQNLAALSTGLGCR